MLDHGIKPVSFERQIHSRQECANQEQNKQFITIIQGAGFLPKSVSVRQGNQYYYS